MLKARGGSVGEPFITAAEQAYIASHITARQKTHFDRKWLHVMSVVGATMMLIGATLFTMQTSQIQSLSAASHDNPAAQSLLPTFISSTDEPNLEQIHQSVNSYRASHGLAPLVRSATLSAVAKARAVDMANNDYFAHRSLGGKYFYDDLNARQYSYATACENLDLSSSTATNSIVNDWATSTKGHRECMIKGGATQAGYAVAKLPGTDNATFIVVAIYAQPN